MKTFLLIVLLSVFSTGYAQVYNHSVGLRGGVSSGISYRLFKDELKAMEGILSFRNHGIQLTAIIETYKPLYLKHTDRIYFYHGLGAHIGYTTWYKNDFFIEPVFRNRYYRNKFSPVVGLDGLLGLEYRFVNVPLTVGLDFKPFFEIFGQNFFNLNLWDFGITVHYSFN